MTTPDNSDPKSSSSPLMATQIIHSSQALAVGATLVGRFEIESLQGQGRYGLVYRALDKQLNTMVAIKVLDKSLSENHQTIADFKNELLLVRQLSHPNIIRVHEYYQEQDLHFITMDWIEGDSLENIIAGEKLDTEAKLEVIKQLLSGLAFAQAAGVTHKDIKPENIMLDHDGRLFIADFGLSVFNKDMTSKVRSGTPYYAPPEYLQSGQLNDSTDLYAAGIIIYQLMCDDLPFKGNNLEQVLAEKHGSAPTFKTKSADFKRFKSWLWSLIATHPESRPKNIETALTQFLQIESQPTQSRTPLYATAASIVLVALFSLIYLTNPDSNISAGDDQIYSIALLPNDSTSETVSEDFNLFLTRELMSSAQIRIVEPARVNEIFQRLGFSKPLSDPQLKLLFELLNLDVLVNSTKVKTSEKQTQARFEIIHLSGNLVRKESLLNTPYSSENWRAVSKPFIAALENKLSLQKDNSNSISRSTDVDSVAYQSFIKAEDYFFQFAAFEAEQHYSKVLDELDAEADTTYLGVLSQARLNELAGNIDEAEKQYQKLIDAFPNDVTIKMNLAEMFEYTEQPQKATALLKNVVKLDPNLPQAWYMLGKAAYSLGEFDIAIDEYFLKALVIAKKVKNIELQGVYLNAFGVVYEQTGEHELAIDYYQQALTQRQAVDDKPGVAKTLTNLADVYLVIGKYAQAERMLNQSKDINEDLGNAEGIANNLNALGNLAEEQSQYQRALQFYRDALNIRMDLNNIGEQAESMNNIGYAYFMLMDPEHSLVYWRQAEQLFQQVQSPFGIIRVRQNLAQMQLVKGNWNNAYQIFNSSLKDAEQINSLEESIVARAYLAKLAFIKGNFADSITALEDIFKTLESRNDIRGIAHFGLYLVDWHIKTADIEQAELMLKKLSQTVGQYGSQEYKSRFEYLSLKLQLEKIFVDANQLTKANRNQLLAKTNQLVKKLQLDSAQDRTHRRLYIQSLMDKVTFQLRFPSQLSASDFENINAIMNQLQGVDYQLFQYEKIEYFALLAKLQWLSKDWIALKETLRTAELALRKSGDYWMSFQFDALRVELAAHENRPIENYQKKLNQKLDNLTRHLSETHQQAFLQRAGIDASKMN